MPRPKAQATPAPRSAHPFSPDHLTVVQALDHARQGQNALILVGHSSQAIELTTAISGLPDFTRLNPDDLEHTPDTPEGQKPPKAGTVRVLSCSAPEFLCLDCSTGHIFVDQFPDFTLFLHPSATLRAAQTLGQKAKADSEAADLYAQTGQHTPDPPAKAREPVKHGAGR